MTQRLHIASFHSVKGGVGKSTLAVTTAWTWAVEHPGVPVYLVDMDLTGGGLADALALNAPCWAVRSDPTLAPDRHVSSGRLDGQAQTTYINDFLLHTPEKWDSSVYAIVDYLAWRAWRPTCGPSNLRVLPALVTPEAVHRIMPVLDDENHSCFLESRLEWLLESVLRIGTKEVRVVIDNSPGMHGHSLAGLSLCIRLGSSPKRPLSADRQMPFRLESADVTARGLLVTTPDAASAKPTARIAAMRLPDEPVTVVTTRAEGGMGIDAAVPDMLILENVFKTGAGPVPAPEVLRAIGL